jgi:predicted RNA-binding Zn-ribbon protein involved in translation (DUF1610 family)
MELKRTTTVEIPPELIEAIRAFPLQREVTHCGHTFNISPFDVYADCPHCGKHIKVRSFSGGTEIEDVFEAVFAWMLQNGASEIVSRHQAIIAADED